MQYLMLLEKYIQVNISKKDVKESEGDKIEVMEIRVKFDSKNPEDIGINFDGFREEVDLSNPEELIFDSSAIVLVVLDGVINQIAKSEPPNKKKELAEIIIQDVKKKAQSQNLWDLGFRT